jgi:FUS-interacting serine-arginine-rich protein 1
VCVVSPPIRQPKPFAFVEFDNYDDARDAKDDMDRREFQGRVIDVVFAQQKRKSSNEMRARDGPPPRR